MTNTKSTITLNMSSQLTLALGCVCYCQLLVYAMNGDDYAMTVVPVDPEVYMDVVCLAFSS